MAVDTPAKIAILGVGPIGLEAALYARYLGYEVEVFDKHPEIAADCSSEASLDLPFQQASSPLGRAAIANHDPAYKLPEPGEVLGERAWRDNYLTPLSQTDLISDHLRLETEVLAIGKIELSKSDCPSGEFDRGNWDFRLLVQQRDEPRRLVIADVVLDCSGVACSPLPLGQGGVPALGEDEFGREIEYDARQLFRNPQPLELPDPSVRKRYRGKSVLIVGNHASAVRAASVLSRLAQTRVTWVTVGAATTAISESITTWPETWVESISKGSERRFLVTIAGGRDETIEFDEIISLNGFRPDWSFTRELQLDICPITDAPRPFSQYLLNRPSPNSVEYPAPGSEALITSEPNYYVLGSKSFGRMSGFLFQHGRRQIRDVFTIIGDRADLDLYAGG
jgi:hypothetical protein